MWMTLRTEARSRSPGVGVGRWGCASISWTTSASGVAVCTGSGTGSFADGSSVLNELEGVSSSFSLCAFGGMVEDNAHCKEPLVMD